MTARIGVAGTGSYMPETVITNDVIARLVGIDDKGADWAYQKLGIEARRFMTPLDATGKPVAQADELDMAEQAARRAIASADMEPDQVDGLYFVSCTADHRFNKSVMELHKRLGLKKSALALDMDAGCGGALHAIVNGTKIIKGNCANNILVIASNGPSRNYDNWPAYVANKVWHSMYIFGDGAGATMLKKYEGGAEYRGSEIIASFTACDPSIPLMRYETRGNSLKPLFIIDSKAVFASFKIFAKAALEGLKKECDFDYDDVDRFYFHQVNGRVLNRFVDDEGIPAHKVPVHVDRYGNIAAAATLVLLDEDRRADVMSSGKLCVFCTVGAGTQYGAALVRL